MNVSLTDFYRVLRNAARFFPATSPVKQCLQLQAFRVLQRDPRTNAEVGTDTLGAVPTDKDHPFFWSRQWELEKTPPGKISYQYPLLTAFELINEAGSGIFGGAVDRVYTLELAVLDAFRPEQPKISKPGSCDGRPINQIYLDTEFLLDSVMKYIGGSVVATTTSDPTQKIYYKPFLEATVPGNYDVKQELGLIWAGLNSPIQYVRVEYPAKNLYGTKVRFKFRADKCQTVDFTTTAPDLGKIGFEAGCSDC